MQGLVLLPNILGSQPGCHRLHALTLARQKQSHAIVLQGSFPIGVPGGLRQAIPIRRKALFSWAWRRRCGAHKNNIPLFCLPYNIVILWLLDGSDVHLDRMSHAADTQDFEAFYREELLRPYIEDWVFFVLESPGGQDDNGDARTHRNFTKRPPNNAYYWLPDDRNHWPTTLGEVLQADNSYGPYLAYLIKRFRLKNAYFTNAVNVRPRRERFRPIPTLF